MRNSVAAGLVLLLTTSVLAAACGSDDGKRAVMKSAGGAGGAGGDDGTTPGGGGGSPQSEGASGGTINVRGEGGASGAPTAGATGADSGQAGAGASRAGGDGGLGGSGGAGGVGGDGGTGGGAGANNCDSSSAAPTTFSDDFTQLQAKHWAVSQTTADLYSVDASQGDVRLAKADGNPSGLQNVALVLDLESVGGPVLGDFEEAVAFANASLGTTGVYQVELHAHFQDGSYFFVVYDNSSGVNVHIWDGAIHAPLTTAQTGGSFRIARSGTTLAGYFGNTLVWSTTATAPLVGAEFMLQVQPNTTEAESVTFDDFLLRGACVTAD